jgi:nitric oxide reductase subunit B
MEEQEALSSGWKHAVIVTVILGFTVLIWLAARTYHDAPPIPARVINAAGETIFTREDILAGQQVFLKYGLMENGSIWGHGAYLGPDFSAAYLHALGVDASERMAHQRYGRPVHELTAAERSAINTDMQQALKQNRYDPQTQTLVLTPPEIASYRDQIAAWTTYFSHPTVSAGLPITYIKDPQELQQLTAFFAWTAWAAVTNRPGHLYSYTNNFPYDPTLGNTPTPDAVLWSALSLIALLVGIALVLFAFGKFDYLGWHGQGIHIHPHMLPGMTTASQQATIKYFVLVAGLFLAQVLVGGGTAHYRADPGSLYGLDVSSVFPSHILRTWHVQLAIFWIATAYVAGGLLLAPALGGHEPTGQARGVNLLFGVFVVVVVGSLVGEMLGIRQLLGVLWFWFGHQGWEYLDLGRAWQIGLALGLTFWLILLYRGIAPARQAPASREVASLFLYAALAIPLFYVPAMFFNSTSHFSVVDIWRFWIIHLWVEGFFELFVTVMVATMFYKLGLVSHVTAARVVYLDALLYLGSGIIGTGHHWYWTGQSHITMALAATFSALEVVPLTLLTLDAWDFMKLTQGHCDICGTKIAVPHKWTFYFLMAVGVWNFVGAGVFGFLINLPIVSYFEVGTILTPNHGHTAMMGVFGMLALALMVFALRQVVTDTQWVRPEKYLRVAFWGLNSGLVLMVVTNLLPAGVLQFVDVLEHGYWHARSAEFLHARLIRSLEWLRLPGDLLFIGCGVAPLVVAAVLTLRMLKPPAVSGEQGERGPTRTT